jgi:hypothetical protein
MLLQVAGDPIQGGRLLLAPHFGNFESMLLLLILLLICCRLFFFFCIGLLCGNVIKGRNDRGICCPGVIKTDPVIFWMLVHCLADKIGVSSLVAY